MVVTSLGWGRGGRWWWACGGGGRNGESVVPVFPDEPAAQVMRITQLYLPASVKPWRISPNILTWTHKQSRQSIHVHVTLFQNKIN